MEEQQAFNQEVAGSNPAGPTAARIEALDSVSLRRRLPLSIRWIHAVALTAARASLVRPLACLRGFPCSLDRRFNVAFTSGRDVGSSCPPRRCAAAIAARRRRTVASVRLSVSTRCSM